MKGDDLPEDDHIVRYFSPRKIRDDGTPDGSNFKMRSERLNESGLSVNWLEVLGENRNIQLTEVRRLCRLRLSKNGRFAQMNIGVVKHKVREELDTLRIVHDPLDPEGVFEADPSHSEIIGLPPSESDQAMIIGDLIAQCVTDMHPTT